MSVPFVVDGDAVEEFVLVSDSEIDSVVVFGKVDESDTESVEVVEGLTVGDDDAENVCEFERDKLRVGECEPPDKMQMGCALQTSTSKQNAMRCSRRSQTRMRSTMATGLGTDPFSRRIARTIRACLERPLLSERQNSFVLGMQKLNGFALWWSCS